MSVADYRFSRNDIGIVKDGRVDLRVRISPDNGHNWQDIFAVIEGKGKDSPDFMNVGFGDPSIVADRESGKILLMCAAGNVSFLDGTRECHLRLPRFYSTDKGRTWTQPEDISEQLYGLLDNSPQGPAKSMFVTSGRIVQSRYVKVGEYYRIYCAILAIAGDDSWKNYVIYSDDFGAEWKILGGAEQAAIPYEANEAKVEELPGGAVMITSRTDRFGRNLNIFTFSDLKKAEGEWGIMAHSSSHNNGIITEKNSCNGELLVVPVIRNADKRQMHLILQSVPFGPKRSNVGICFKGVEPAPKYSTEALARDWEGEFRATNIGSAYSVMALQSNGKVGFMYEEKTYYPTSGAGYTIVYNAYTIDEITSGAYSLRTDVDPVKELVSLLTPEEKCELIIGGRSPMFKHKAYTKIKPPGAAGVINEIPRLGIPAVVLSDGPAGVRIRAQRPNDDRTFYCTGFPIGSLISSTWNTDLVYDAGVAMGVEAKEYGIDVLLSPGINIHRNPLCGRNFEYYSEDPFLTGKIAAAMINGVESNNVGTSLKHYAVNNQETNRLANNSLLSERALREIYLKGFEIAVKEAQPWTIMSSYNYINGEHASQSYRLLTEILRDEWGFEGLVMSDWGAGYDTAAQIRAGNDIVQPGEDKRYAELLQAVKDGSLSMEALDRSIERILRLALGTNRHKGIPYSEAPDLKASAKVSQTVAQEGIILLKNNKETLPLAKKGDVALFGVTSYDFIAGGTGSGDVNRPYVINLLQGLTNEKVNLNKEVTYFYEAYMADEKQRCDRINGNNGWQIDRERAIEVVHSELIEKAAQASDCAIITLGRVFGEGKDRNYHYNYLLSNDELRLIDQVSKEFHAKGKKVSVILNIGGLIDVNAWADKVDAILLCWLPGQEGGNAVASVLTGKINPSGHLPATMSKDYFQEPSAPNFPILYADKPFNYSFYRQLDGSVRDLIKDIDYTKYEEGIYVGYRYFNTFKKSAIAFPFGHGLSYTDFDFKKMEVVPAQGGWKVMVTVENVGKVKGKDVVQLYVKAPGKDMDKPARELKGFAKTPDLNPGEICTVEIFVTQESLASYDEGAKAWVVEKGTYDFIAAKDASDNSKTKKVAIK